jgi:nicotinamide riboside kinase
MIVINLYGGPGCGKSTAAASLFSMLKMTGINCELVTEFAKDLTWDESSRVLGYQPYVFGQQAWRLERLSGKVDMVITDSPLILSTVYCDPALPQSWHDYVLWEHNRHSSMNFFIKRSNNYVQVGRNQSLEDAEKIDSLILHKLKYLNIEVTEFLSGDGTAPIKAYAKIISETNIIKKAN